MEKIKCLKKSYSGKDDNSSEVSASSQARSGHNKRILKLAEEANEIRQKRLIEETKRNRIKLTLEFHQQMDNEIELAAVCIQKNARRFLAMRQVQKIMMEKLDYERYLIEVQTEIGKFWAEDASKKHIAAYRIQRYWKGFRKNAPKIETVKRLVKRFIGLKELKERKEKKLKIFRGLEAIKGIFGRILCAGRNEKFRFWKSAEYRVKSLDEKKAEDLAPNNYIEIIQTENNLKDIQILTDQGVEALINKPQDLAKPKMFVLSEANFQKPTLASYKKRFEVPEPPKEKKKKAIKALKSRRLLKQTTSRLVYVNEINKDTKKREQSAQPRVSTEAKIPFPPKYQNVPSRFKENLRKSTARSTSFKIERLELKEEKGEILNLALDFKQALPDLYEFIENYKPNVKKNAVIQSTSCLVVNKLK